MIVGRIVAAALAAYLLGSIPFGYVIVRRWKGLDLTQVGSGHTGGTNVLRAAGGWPAAITVVLDCLKGYLSVVVARALVPDSSLLAALCGTLSIVGHNYSVFLLFKGGVGTMTTGGAALALFPWMSLAAVGVSIAVLYVSRYSSLASLTFAVLVTVICVVGVIIGAFSPTYLVFGLGTTALSVWALRTNVARLLAGQERRVGQVIADGEKDVCPDADRPGG